MLCFRVFPCSTGEEFPAVSAVPGKQNSKGGVSQAIRLRDVLEDEIVNGELKPGDRLDEAALAERFGVSRTPIREAFKYLVGSGLVETIPNRGSFVASVGLPQLIEMFEVMAELEGMCARLAARRMSDNENTQLKTLLDSCTRASATG
ncbi:MAG: GntR family transcriptional regulator, partial [Gammaproteobacteria bacterium]|nr:GntR family transcriptional regulator [Gammaproteobacteria bacterium]